MDDREIKWCDPDCPCASFPEAEHLDGACHTFIALYCSKHRCLVQKSALCLDLKEEREDDARYRVDEETDRAGDPEGTR